MMKKLDDRVRFLFETHIAEKIALIDSLSMRVAESAQKLVECLLQDGKILVCGNGGSAANALHFSTALLNHFEVERPPLPVITLGADCTLFTSMMNENNSEQIFSRQINALGQPNDILLVISTSGNANNLLHALNTAHERGMDVIILGGHNGELLSSHLSPKDLELHVPGDNIARIREIHLFILHCFCDLIEQSLFGQLSAND